MAVENQTTRSITLGDVLRYAFLPGVVPRMRGLIGSGFGSFAFFMALVYRAVRLLPDGHPFLNPRNIGRYGMMAVVFEAARFIKFNRYQLRQNNIDQIIVFVAVLIALFLLLAQFFTLALAVMMPSAMAFSFSGTSLSFPTVFHMFDTPKIGVTDYSSSFVTASGMVSRPQNFYDVSFMFLDRVFGVPGVFNSCIADGVPESCKPIGAMYGTDVKDFKVNDPGVFPWPYHHALHGIFSFYSVGLLIVAVFLLVYFTIVVVIETAQTGTPFGKRFDTVWAPLRLVVAAGLLIPISSGLNSGQYVVLYAAKWGANFASNGWIGFNGVLTSASSTALGSADTLIARPNTPSASEMSRFFSLMHACQEVQEDFILPWAVQGGAYQHLKGEKPHIKPYIVRSAGTKGDKSVAQELTKDTKLIDAVKWSGNADVVVRYGIKDDIAFKSQQGKVSPVCGEIIVPINFFPASKEDAAPKTGGGAPAPTYDGASKVVGGYWDLLKDLTFITKKGEAYPARTGTGISLPWNIREKLSSPFLAAEMRGRKLGGGKDNTTALYKDDGGVDAILPQPSDRAALAGYLNARISSIVDQGIEAEKASAASKYAIPIDLLARGWAAAGIWYNRIAEMNGVFTTAVWNMPKISLYPETMMLVAKYKQEVQVNTSVKEIFAPMVGTGYDSILFPNEDVERRSANVYWLIIRWWQSDNVGEDLRNPVQGNPILDTINGLFGTSGLFSIRKNANVHPMAQLSSIGKSLVDRSVTILGMGLLSTAAQPWITNEGFRAIATVVSNFTFSILSIGASAGFILYYIIPFLPFIYFFFAVGGWVKAIFEAMVGVPLWALAHIRIDGHGLPGEAAQQGYFLILEIMLRPILIVFGLVASVTIYAASVHVLNDIFNLAVANVTGVDLDAGEKGGPISLENIRGAVDTFFYTIMYVVLVYMLGQSSFKLIDLIPASMLRWFGSGANTITDSGAEASGQMVGYGSMGSQVVFGQLSGAAKQGVSGMSEMLKGAVKH